MDMWKNLWANYVTPKSQLAPPLRIGPQDVVHTSKFVPYTDTVFGAESLEILDRVRVRLPEFGDPVHKRDHDFIGGQRVFNQIGQRKRLAQVHHVITRNLKRDLGIPRSDLWCEIAKAQPCGVCLDVYQNLVQGDLLSGGDIGSSNRSSEEDEGEEWFHGFGSNPAMVATSAVNAKGKADP